MRGAGAGYVLEALGQQPSRPARARSCRRACRMRWCSWSSRLQEGSVGIKSAELRDHRRHAQIRKVRTCSITCGLRVSGGPSLGTPRKGPVTPIGEPIVINGQPPRSSGSARAVCSAANTSPEAREREARGRKGTTCRNHATRARRAKSRNWEPRDRDADPPTTGPASAELRDRYALAPFDTGGKPLPASLAPVRQNRGPNPGNQPQPPEHCTVRILPSTS